MIVAGSEPTPLFSQPEVLILVIPVSAVVVVKPSENVTAPDAPVDIVDSPNLIVVPLKYKSLNRFVAVPKSCVISEFGTIFPGTSSVPSDWKSHV